jgi:hypothetical protein
MRTVWWTAWFTVVYVAPACSETALTCLIERAIAFFGNGVVGADHPSGLVGSCRASMSAAASPLRSVRVARRPSGDRGPRRAGASIASCGDVEDSFDVLNYRPAPVTCRLNRGAYLMERCANSAPA